jgi:hypothetical protein
MSVKPGCKRRRRKFAVIIGERVARRVTPSGDIEFGFITEEDGTVHDERYERRESRSVSFNEVRYPDGRTTIERIEHAKGDKDFRLVLSPDGSHIEGSLEHANGITHQNFVTDGRGRTKEAGPTQ